MSEVAPQGSMSSVANKLRQAVLLRDTKAQITRFSFSMINNVTFSLPITSHLCNFQHHHTCPAYVDLYSDFGRSF